MRFFGCQKRWIFIILILRIMHLLFLSLKYEFGEANEMLLIAKMKENEYKIKVAV